MTIKNAQSEALKKLQKALRSSGFTLAELIVVITILAILAVIGFIALSGYSQDAKDSAIKANVRSVYSAITAESALTGNSPRYYIVHDFTSTGASLSGAIVYFDGNVPTTLSGGNWNDANTNYSAGNPDYVKLKLNKEKFRVSELSVPYWPTVLAASNTGATNTSYLIVGAADATITTGGKTRTASYVQVAGIPSTGTAVVTGNIPASALTGTGASTGLIRDMSPTNLSSTGALKDGGSTTIVPTSSSSSSTSSSGGGGTCIFDDAGSTFDNCTFGA